MNSARFTFSWLKLVEFLFFYLGLLHFYLMLNTINKRKLIFMVFALHFYLMLNTINKRMLIYMVFAFVDILDGRGPFGF